MQLRAVDVSLEKSVTELAMYDALAGFAAGVITAVLGMLCVEDFTSFGDLGGVHETTAFVHTLLNGIGLVLADWHAGGSEVRPADLAV